MQMQRTAAGRHSWLRRRRIQIAKQTALDHFIRVLCDPEYWREISYQELNNNLLLLETIKLIEQMKVCDIDILERHQRSVELG